MKTTVILLSALAFPSVLQDEKIGQERRSSGTQTEVNMQGVPEAVPGAAEVFPMYGLDMPAIKIELPKLVRVQQQIEARLPEIELMVHGAAEMAPGVERFVPAIIVQAPELERMVRRRGLKRVMPKLIPLRPELWKTEEDEVALQAALEEQFEQMKRARLSVPEESKGAERLSATASRREQETPSPFEECDVEMVVVKEEEEEGEGEEVKMNIYVTCPLLKIPQKTCPWIGSLRQLKEHVVWTHSGILKTVSTFQCTSLHTTALLILFNEELFLYYKFISDYGHWYAVVQQVGTTNKKYMYKIKLHSEDETVPDRVYIFRVTSIREDFEVLFDAPRCFASTDQNMEPFITEHGVDMRVTLKRPSRASRWD